MVKASTLLKLDDIPKFDGTNYSIRMAILNEIGSRRAEELEGIVDETIPLRTA